MIKNRSLVYDKAYPFAVRVVKAVFFLKEHKKEHVLSKQLLRSGTSIGANTIEVNGAISDDDFSSKMSIAYKECLETKYWLSLLKDTKYIDENTFNNMYEQTDEIGKMLFAILKKTRINKRKINQKK